LTQNYPVNIYSSSELDTSLLIRFVENYKRGVLQKSFFDESSKKTIETASGLLLSYKSGTFTVNSFLVTENGFIESSIPSPSEQNNKFITTDYIDYTEIAELWDQITLTPKEEQLLDALRILEPEVERISFTSAPASNNRILLKLKGRNAPVPLSSMGDGMRRMLALAASLVSSEKGALLIDEIDTGLHYKALTNMWRLIIETAKKLDVQIFATTHSWDCLAAFQQALTQTKEDDLGTVFRLERKNGQIDHVSYTGKELAVAVAHDIEVR
jgi:AAA15 family ATPase/GTPase